MNKLVSRCLRKWVEEKMEQIVKTKEDHLGENHKDTLYVKNGLAALFILVGEKDKAEELCRENLLSYESMGTDSDDSGLLKCKSALAFIHEKKSEYAEAKVLYMSVLGTNQPQTYSTNMFS